MSYFIPQFAMGPKIGFQSAFGSINLEIEEEEEEEAGKVEVEAGTAQEEKGSLPTAGSVDKGTDICFHCICSYSHWRHTSTPADGSLFASCVYCVAIRRVVRSFRICRVWGREWQHVVQRASRCLLVEQQKTRKR